MDENKVSEENLRTPSNKKKSPGTPIYKRPVPVTIFITVLICLIVAGVLWWRHSRKYESTDDAFVDAHVEHVSARVSGHVISVLVNDNQDVIKGSVVAELDPSDFQAQVAQAIAKESQGQSKVAQAKAQVSVLHSQLDQARANVQLSEANARNAENTLKRYVEVNKRNSGAIPKQQLEDIATAEKSAQAQLTVAKKAVTAAESQEVFARSEVEGAAAELQSVQAQRAQAELNLSYTKVKATVSGRVSSKTVAPGNVVQAGTELMAVVPKEVFITANFKETQLNRVRGGQAVTIHVDAYPDLELSGKVEGVQVASGQAFSMLPAQNATGNWVKIVQRVPVKILFDQIPNDPYRIGPGMSTEVTVSIE